MAADEPTQQSLMQRIWLVVAAVLVLSDAALIASGILSEIDVVQHQSLRMHLQYIAQGIGLFDAALILGAVLALTQAQANTPRELTILTWLARSALFLATLISAASLYQAVDPLHGLQGANARAGQIISALTTLIVGALALTLSLTTLLHIHRARASP